MKLFLYAIGPETSKGVIIYGGTRFWVEMCKRWGKHAKSDIHIIGSPGTRRICMREGIKAHFYIPRSSMTNTKNIQPLYFLCLLKQLIETYCLEIQLAEGIVFSPSHYLWDVFPPLGSKRNGARVKWIVIVHNIIPRPTSRKGNWLSNTLAFLMQTISLGIVRRHADAIFAINRSIRRYLIQCGFAENKVFLTSNGVPIKHISKVKPLADYYDASFMGRLHPTKGIFDLIEIWRLVTKQDKNARLAIIGTGSPTLVSEFRKQIKENGLENNLLILGYLPPHKAYSVIKSSRVFVFPSYEESWGISVCEAMACGLPVVAYDLDAYKNFADAVVKVPLGDVGNFAEAISTMLSEEALRTGMGRKAKEVASKFDLDQIAKENQAVFEDAGSRGWFSDAQFADRESEV